MPAVDRSLSLCIYMPAIDRSLSDCRYEFAHNPASTNDEFSITNDEFSVKIDEFSVKIDEFSVKIDEFSIRCRRLLRPRRRRTSSKQVKERLSLFLMLNIKGFHADFMLKMTVLCFKHDDYMKQRDRLPWLRCQETP